MNSQVLTCILAMISMLRSQKANNFQVTIGLFLLASGASKRESSCHGSCWSIALISIHSQSSEAYVSCEDETIYAGHEGVDVRTCLGTI